MNAAELINALNALGLVEINNNDGIIQLERDTAKLCLTAYVHLDTNKVEILYTDEFADNAEEFEYTDYAIAARVANELIQQYDA